MISFPVTAAPPDVDELVVALADARVLDAARLTALSDDFDAEHPTGDAAEFADQLVRHGFLTQYQAEAALAGDPLSVGPFLLLDPVGANDLGATYHAIHRENRRPYAVRVIPLRSLWKSHQAKKLLARFAALPPHPALVPAVDVDTDGGSHYMAWEYAEGESLRRAVERSGPLREDIAARLFADLADGLATCHAAGLAHGRLTPSAVLIDPEGLPRLLDLGLGDILADNTDDDSMFDTISTANAALGMIDYAPPEAADDPALRSPAGDAYGLGAVMYFALTGGPPFPVGDVVDRMLAQRTRSPEPVRTRNPRVTIPLAELVERLLAKNPDDRPAVADVRDELRARPTGEPLPDSSADSVLLSATVSSLRRSVEELPIEFVMRKRSVAEEDDDGAVSFDLPEGEPAHESIADFPVPTPTKTPKPMAAAPPPRTIVLPSTPAKSGPAAPPPRLPVAPLRPVDLPRPVGWETSGPTPASETASLSPEAAPKPPRRGGGVLGALAFWKSAADEVQLSLFGPPEIAPGQRVHFVAYAHLPGVADNIGTLCRAMHKTAELLGVGFLDRRVPRGTALALHLSLAGAGVAKSLVTFTWAGQPQPKTFDVFVPWESPPGPTSGVLTAGIDEELAASVPVRFVVLPRGR